MTDPQADPDQGIHDANALYDYLGASAFRLLCALGLRAHHRVLSLGCGSLSCERLLIPYLEPRCLHAIEPDQALLEAGLARHLGDAVLDIKQPVFAHGDRFDLTQLKGDFDYVLIASHLRSLTLEDAGQLLSSLRARLRPRGRIVCSLPDPATQPSPWTETALNQLSEAAQMCCQALPWYHPEHRWYLIAADPTSLVPFDQLQLLNGAVLFDADLVCSRDPRIMARSRVISFLQRLLPAAWRR